MVHGIREVARGCGYAIGEHGSRVRDLDLIACPWTEWAIDPYDFVWELCVKLDLHVSLEPSTDMKPHGRIAWILVAFPFDYSIAARIIDLSVMPRK